MSRCPHCGSVRTANRRHLFSAMMDRLPPPEGFEWYGEGQHNALPPKSLFLQAGLFSLLALLPLYGLSLAGFIGCYSFYVTGFVAVGLVASALVIDALHTFGRYRRWASESLCGDCRGSFIHEDNYLTTV